MKVAICFYGQPRRYKQVLEQWNKVISELGADVFIHTWYGQDRGRVDIDVNELINDFSPKEIEVSSPHRFIDLIPKDANYENQSYHGMNQAYTINKVYDVVIKSRFDITLLDVDMFIEFVKNKIEEKKLYVAANHWIGSDMFDDNIMVGTTESITNMSNRYFKYTIDFINTTKIIPGGEQNVFRYINHIGELQNITKIDSVNFKLIPLPFNEIILNQNEK
jgi:hypothetical protein